MLTNVSYRRFKQSDFNNQSFIIDILSFLVQNFNPINLDIKLDIEKERDMTKFMWDECILHEFVSFIYKEKYYNGISQPNLTYQRANNIVKEYLFEDWNRISYLKFKAEEKFELIHYIYSLLFSKIYNRTNSFGIKRKNNFDFNVQIWKKNKMQNNLKQVSLMKVNLIAKDPSNYETREVEKHQQVPFDISLHDESPTMIYSITKDGDEVTLKKQTEKRKILEKKNSRKHYQNEKNEKN